jgi:hypothetical protein
VRAGGKSADLLLHGLVDGDLVLVVHLVELVDAADAVVREHQRTGLPRTRQNRAWARVEGRSTAQPTALEDAYMYTRNTPLSPYFRPPFLSLSLSLYIQIYIIYLDAELARLGVLDHRRREARRRRGLARRVDGARHEARHVLEELRLGAAGIAHL